MEGSVDEGSTKSDEEYDDLAMQDGIENGYWSDDEESDGMPLLSKINTSSKEEKNQTEYYRQNLGRFLNDNEQHLDHISDCLRFYSIAHERNHKFRRRPSTDMQLQDRAQSLSSTISK